MGFPLFPTYTPVPSTVAGVVSRETLTRSATKAEDRQATFAAEGTTLPIIYGQDVCAGKVAGIVNTTTYLWLLVVWCAGEDDSIVSTTMNGESTWHEVTQYNHLGSLTQTVDTYLQAACSSKGISYTDALPGVCYSAFKVSQRSVDTYPEFAAVIKGRKVYDPRLDSTAILNLVERSEQFDLWSNNGLAVTTNAMVAPNGTTTAETSAATGGTRYVLSSVTVTAGQQYTYSLHVKPADPTKTIYMYTDGPAGTGAAYIVPSTGVVSGMIGTANSIVVSSVGNGWYRCSLTFTPSSTGYAAYHIYPTSTDLHGWWGAQLELGATAGAYWPTTTFASATQRLDTPSTWTWSDNPALCLADFVRSNVYGMGRAIDASSVVAVANKCDEIVGGQKRRTLNLSLIQEQTVDAWLDTLRAYAGCLVSDEGGTLRLVPFMTGSSVMTFDASNIVDGSMRLQKAGVVDIPTVLRVTYTDTSATPYRDGEAVAYAPGALAGTVPWRESTVPMPGINRYSQANREAIERLNALTLSDLKASFTCFDIGLKLQLGDPITVTHPIGLTAKPMWLSSITDLGFGRYALVAEEFDSAILSDTVVSEPTTVDSGLTIAGTPPTLTGLAATEEIYRTGDGLISSRLRISWTDPEWPNTLNYLVTITDATVLVHQGTAWDEIYVTPALQEGKTYGIGVRVISRAGVAGDEATTAKAMVGKIGTLPGDVPSLTCTEVAGKVYARWTAATDLDTLDYELRYGAASVTWAAATYLQRISSLAYTIEGITSGTYDFLIKARDSYKQESANATRAAGVVITSDTAAPQLGSRAMTSPTLVDMAAVGSDWATTDAGNWSAGYTGTAWDSDSRAGNAWNNPTGSTGSSWTSEAWDLGMNVAATVTTDLTATDIVGGPSVVQIGYSTTTSVVGSMTWVTALTVDATVRYLRVRATMGSGGAISIAGPVNINYSGFTV
jgi:hypothetical protein